MDQFQVQVELVYHLHIVDHLSIMLAGEVEVVIQAPHITMVAQVEAVQAVEVTHLLA
jgi:hypothetical protein